MKTLRILVLICTSFVSSILFSQQTVGLFMNTADSYDGYTLFAAIGSKTTYLIDNCGEEIHSWTSLYRPALSVYLLENGNLLRTGNTMNSSFNSGGSGGVVEMIDWDGNVIWDYTLSSTTACIHHDIEYLPNGNILVISWDSKTATEASDAGRITSGSVLWSEKVLEIQPDLVNGGGTIVWEWFAWDHLVQDVDFSKENYGSVSGSPQLININYYSGEATGEDWLHINSIDYNEELDQIILSNHNFSEVWVIDHSTTTQEAASHLGGDSNNGGDLLYRWGNPQAYNQGTVDDQKLFSQHDAYWIEDSLTDGGMIMVYNNQLFDTDDYSEVNIIDSPVDTEGNYTYLGEAFLPIDFHWTYQANNPHDFYSRNISGAQRLANSNTLICEGTTGRFFEIDYTGNIVWEYVNPVNGDGIIPQEAPAFPNSVFRCNKYSANYSGFNGKTLVSQGYLESGSTFTCELFSEIKDIETKSSFSIFPNPVNNKITILSDFRLSSITIYNSMGEKLVEQYSNKKELTISTDKLTNGIYVVRSKMGNGTVVVEKIIVAK